MKFIPSPINGLNNNDVSISNNGLYVMILNIYMSKYIARFILIIPFLDIVKLPNIAKLD